jgi:hypothetical protein
MKAIRTLFVLLFLGAASLARATDFTDLWWNQNENGWGVNVAHQDNILFLTFFLYGPNNQPYWVSASNTVFQGADNSGNLVYTGPLAQTSGPWFGTTPYNPATVTPQGVGTVTFTATSGNTATLTYTINGTAVTKQITRLTFRGNPNVNGNYFGGLVGDATNCTPSTNNGHFEGALIVNVSGTAAASTIVLQGNGASCTFAGPYAAAGRMGSLTGTVNCTTGVSGTVNVFEIEANTSGLSARYQATYSNNCRENGHFGGVRR